MNSRQKIKAGVVALSLLGFSAVATLGVAEAEACMPAPESVTWTFPGESMTIGPDQSIEVLLQGGAFGDRFVELLDSNNQSVAIDVQASSMPLLFGSRISIIGADSLPNGQYTLSIEFQNNAQANFSLEFNVSNILASTIPGIPDLGWRQETLSQAVGNSCNFSERYDEISIDGQGQTVAYFELMLRDENDNESVAIVTPAQADGAFRWYRGQFECVAVRAIATDGTPGDELEICSPDKCVHYDDPLPPDLGLTDWSEVAGCGEDGSGDDDGDSDTPADDDGDGDSDLPADEDGDGDAVVPTDNDGDGDGPGLPVDGDGDDHLPEDGDGDGDSPMPADGDSDQGDQDHDNDSDSDSDEDADGDYEEEGTSGGCATTEGGPSSALFALLLLGLLALRKSEV